jgi:outer membrane protein OmpA-like peptidoglycan-associated protein
LHRIKKKISSLKELAKLNNELNAIAPMGGGVFSSAKEAKEMFNNLATKNAQLNKDIDASVAAINKSLSNKNISKEDELCLLYRKNELLNLRDYKKAKSNEVARTSKDPAPAQAPIAYDQGTSNKATNTPAPQYIYTSSRDTIVLVSKETAPAANNDMANLELENLRREIGNLRREVMAYQTSVSSRPGAAPLVKIIRDTLTVEKEIIVEKPVIVEKIVERVIEKPTVQIVEKIVEKPVEKVIEKTFTRVEELLAIPPDVVLFDIGKSNIKPVYNSRLNFYATQLKKYKDLQVMLSGYTDASGNAAANKILSDKRAAAVKAYLMARGVAASQIETEFFGADSPIADNNTAGNKSQNRRVELKFNR